MSEINNTVPLGQSALSQHLATLRTHNVVSTRRDAQTIYYSLTDERVKNIISLLYRIFCQ